MNEQPYIDLYKQHIGTLTQHSAIGLNARRKFFFDCFVEVGFPNKHVDAYRHTDLTNELAVDYGLNLNRRAMNVNAKNLFQCDVRGIQSYLCYVVNDSFYLSEGQELPEGVILCSLREASEKYPEIVDRYLSVQAVRYTDGFVAFNGAFAQDGLFLYVADGVRLDRPIQLVNLMSATADLMANSHNLIVIGKEAKAQLLVCDHLAGDVLYFSNRVTEVFMDEHSTYEHYKLESTGKNMCNVCSLLVKQASDSNFLGNIITLHNGKTRNNIHIDLDGRHCETQLCGMVAGDGQQVVDNTTAINHNQPDCTSNELFKYVLDEHSLGIFNGILKVQPDAQRTAAFQTNRNLLLADTAHIKTRPQLEIYADDVKCSHGATTGQLDETALFYMRQRGISEREARLLLMSAFVNDVIDNIRVEALRDRIRLMVEKRLRGEDTKCHSCKACQ